MSEELKPCPFCGKTDIEFDEDDHALFCMDCNAQGPEAQPDGIEAAIAAWNTRAASGQVSLASVEKAILGAFGDGDAGYCSSDEFVARVRAHLKVINNREGSSPVGLKAQLMASRERLKDLPPLDTNKLREPADELCARLAAPSKEAASETSEEVKIAYREAAGLYPNPEGMTAARAVAERHLLEGAEEKIAATLKKYYYGEWRFAQIAAEIVTALKEGK